jgi:peptidoglycan/xylan/chitin deacetylase (PgdA/CDA1 family)
MHSTDQGSVSNSPSGLKAGRTVPTFQRTSRRADERQCAHRSGDQGREVWQNLQNSINSAAASIIMRAIRFMTPRDTSTLMYHSIPCNPEGHAGLDARAFEAQMHFLKRTCQFISAGELKDRRSQHDPQRVLLTFDDGFRNNFEVVAPILRRHGIPALFFVSSRHCEGGKYLWFAYLRALSRHFKGNGFSFEGEFFDMSRSQREANILLLRDRLLSKTPHPSAMYEAIDKDLPRLSDFVPADEEMDCFAGMTEEQVGQLASEPLFQIGVHTVDHPRLSLCDQLEAERQLEENQTFLERVTGRPCEWVAWPGGDYDLHAIDVCRRRRLRGGFAVVPRLKVAPEWELPRVDVYSSRLNEVCLKTALGSLISAPTCLKFRVLLNHVRNGDVV